MTLCVILLCLTIPVYAMEIEPPEVPEAGEKYMPENTESFADGLMFIFRSALSQLLPEISESAALCFYVFSVTVLVCVVDLFPGANQTATHLVSALLLGVILLKPSNALIALGSKTVTEMTEYSKLLFPVLTGVLAAQGAATASAALYAGSTFFSTVLSTMVSKLVLPMLYGYFSLCIAGAAIGDSMLDDLKKFVKWLVTWGLKIILYVFTAYIGITGVVTGTADASAVKFAKLTISGMVPVVGSIIADASETILVSAGIMKNAVGTYGILAILSVMIGPLLKIGIQTLLLKVTAYICAVFSSKKEGMLLKDISDGLGMILAMTGTVCLLLLISSVCFMKGVS